MEITRGVVPMGRKVVLYGVEGIGKTLLAAKFPGAVFIDTEGSTANYDLARFPSPTSWEMLKQEAEYAQQHPNEVGTLVIDTADWAERLCKLSVCKRNNWPSIETPSFGVGYTQAAEEFGRLLDILDRCVMSNVNVVITAHSTIRRMESPTDFGTYDKYELKCSKQVSPLLKEWCDLLLFLNYKMTIVTEKGKQSGKAQGGQRMMYATKHPAYDAKNRFGLPDEMPMDFAYIAHLFGPAPVPQPNPIPDSIEPAAVSAREDAGNPTIISPADTSVEQAAPPSETPPSAQAASTSEPIDPLTGRPLYEGIYPPAADLMRAADITPTEVELCVTERLGCFPDGMPCRDFPQDFFEQWLMPFWPQVVEWISDNVRKDLPF